MPTPLWLLAVVFAGTWALRLFSTTTFFNDHFMHLAWANQVLAGDWPVRDFADPGMPLTYLVSAAAQVLLGHGLWAEAVLSVTLLAISAALTCHLATRASGLCSLGGLAALLQVIIAPRLYSAPKLLLPLWAVWAFWSYADRPTRGRLAGVVACTVVAALARHDHGIYISMAALLLFVAVHWPQGLRPAAVYASLVVLALLPFAGYVQVNGGIASYLQSGLGFTRAEYSGRRLDERPRFDLHPVPPPSPRIAVRWAATVDDAARVNLENEHRLAEAAAPVGRTWRYTLLDQSPANVRALVNSPEVEDTGGIDRGRSRALGLQDTIAVRLTTLAYERGAPWLTGVFKRQNAVAWMYLLVMGVSWFSLLVVAASWMRRTAWPADDPFPRAVAAAAAILAVATNAGFLRAPLDVRLADATAVPLVLAAWMGGRVWRLAWTASPRFPASAPLSPARAARATIVIALATLGGGATLLSAAELGSFGRTVDKTGIARGPRAMAREAGETIRRLRAAPAIEGWLQSGDSAREIKELSLYVRECTAPEDRLLVAWFAPEIYFYAERPFAAGLAFLYPGFFSSSAEEMKALSRLQAQRVPIVLTRGAGSRITGDHPLLHRELQAHYVQAADLQAADGWRYQILVDRRLSPVRTATKWNLPCFR